MKRLRECGCDCRDDDKIFAGAMPNSICCETCTPEKRPCCYIAQFGCGIPVPLDPDEPWQNYPEWNLTPPRVNTQNQNDPTTAGNVYLRVVCANQEEACKYVSIDSHYYNPGPWWLNVHFKYKTQNTDECFPTWNWAGYGPDGLPVVPNPGSDLSIAWCDQCTWDRRIFISPTVSVQELWILHLDDPDDPVNVTLKHTQFETIEYKIPRASWDCDGPNTLTMTVTNGARRDGGFIQLPTRVCVVPNAEEQHNPCDDRLPCDYSTEEKRCACCDDCCDKRISINFACVGGTTATISGTATAPGRAAQGSADGQTYELFGDVTIDGTTYNVGTVLYCSGGTWKSDLYCDDVFEQTVTIPTECCPLRGTTEWTMQCVDCTVCVALGSTTCDEPVAPIETTCCPDDPVPATLYYTLTSADCPDADGVTGTLEYTDNIASLEFCSLSGAGWEGTLSLGDCSGTIAIQCRNDNTWAGCYATGGGGPNAGLSFGTQVCEPFELSGSTFYTGLPADCCSGEANNTIYITITA